MRQRFRPPFRRGVRRRSTSIRCAPADNAPEDQLDLARPSTEDARVSLCESHLLRGERRKTVRLASICRRLPRVLPKAAAPLLSQVSGRATMPSRLGLGRNLRSPSSVVTWIFSPDPP